MLIKKAKYKKVKVWGREIISNEVYGCDNCKKEIKDYPNETSRLTLDVWDKPEDTNTSHYHFCSWRCLLKFLPKIKSTYFASMPFLYFNEGDKDRSATELIDIIKKIKL